jgi:hypothetical protein
MLLELHQKQVSFYIMDFDTFGNFRTYPYSEEESLESSDNPSFCWKAAAPSLSAESSGLIVYPSSTGHLANLADFKRCTDRHWFEGPERYQDNVVRRPRISGSVDSRNWFRIIRYEKLPSIMGFANSRGRASCKDAEKKWRALIYSSEERPRLAYDHHCMIQEAFNLHIFCSRVQRAGNPYLTRWKPFYITWFQILGDNGSEEEHLMTSSWKSGPLYGSTKGLLLQEACFTLAFLRHRNPKDMDMELDSPWESHPSAVKDEGGDFWTVLLLTPVSRRESGELHGNHATYVLHLIWKAYKQRQMDGNTSELISA